MIISTSNGNGYWSFFSLPNFNPKGNFLLRGNGPKEFVFPPRVGQATFRAEEGNVMIYLADIQKGRLLKMDMNKTLENNSLEINNICDTLPPLLFNFVYIDSTNCLCRTMLRTRRSKYDS